MRRRWVGPAVTALLTISVGVLVNLVTSGWALPIVVSLLVLTAVAVVWEVWLNDQQQPRPNPAQPGRRMGALPEVWNVPGRNAAFAGREELLTLLAQGLREHRTGVVQALHGPGGVGKTQLVIEYAHRHGGDYELVWWIDAGHIGLIAEQLAALAVAAGWISGANASVPSAVAEVGRRLRRTVHWLVIFDNAAGPVQIQDWLPAGPGHVIVTSRNPGWGASPAVPVEVDVFDRAESVELLRSQVPALSGNDADTLAQHLGDLPPGAGAGRRILGADGNISR